MELIYAALLIHKAGNEVNEVAVKKVLDAAGVKVDETKVKALVAALDGVNIDEAIKEAAMTQVSAAPSTESGANEDASKKEEEKAAEEEKKEEAAAGLGSLFG
ncbi:50S ribosomal protein P1 [archaeon]|nr:50S ribosomal protein P1 [archaeon]